MTDDQYLRGTLDCFNDFSVVSENTSSVSAAFALGVIAKVFRIIIGWCKDSCGNVSTSNSSGPDARFMFSYG
jgi:hypothetical protein